MTKLDDSELQMTKNEQSKKVNSATKGAAKFIEELGIPEAPKVVNEAVTVYARKAKQHGQQQLQESWEEKMMHRKYPRRLK